MEKIKLDMRLMTTALCVRLGRRLCDVGCDHGKLSAWLVENNVVSKAIAVDISERSLAKARALFSAHNLDDRAEARLGDGLDPVQPFEADDIVIAGLGYDTIVSVIERAAWLRDKDKRLVLVPSSKHAQLRIWLRAQGFKIVSETVVNCSNKLYTVMTICYCAVSRETDAVYAALGEIKFTGMSAGLYIGQVRARAERILTGSRDEKKLSDARMIMEYLSGLG